MSKENRESESVKACLMFINIIIREKLYSNYREKDYH